MINQIYNNKIVYSNEIKERQMNVFIKLDEIINNSFFSNTSGVFKDFFKRVTDVLHKSNYVSFAYKASNMCTRMAEYLNLIKSTLKMYI